MNLMMLRLSAGRLLLLVFSFAFLPRPAQARMNLPQVRQVILLDEKAAGTVQDYFASPQVAGELPAPLRDSISSSLPDSFRSACGDLMAGWGGESASGSNLWRVRLLDHGGTRAWLALRCRSRLPELADAYDERLALLRVDKAMLELLPLGPDAENDSDLYHLEFAMPLALGGAKGFGFRVKTVKSPCCDGPESHSQERLVIFADPPYGGIIEALAVVTARDDSSHSDNPEVDSTTTYRAEVNFEGGAKGFVSGVTATFREETEEFRGESAIAEPHTVSKRSGVLRFRWNLRTFKFEAAR
jgi:hypothetical protein